MQLIDFYNMMLQARANGAVNELVSRYNGDCSLTYECQSQPVKILKEAVYEKYSGKESLESIFNHTVDTNEEVPFFGVYAPMVNVIVSFRRGGTGTQHDCDIFGGGVLDGLKGKFKDSVNTIAIGHTHPFFRDRKPSMVYGAIPSKIFYASGDLAQLKKLTNKGDFYDFMYERMLWKKYGGDYAEIKSMSLYDSKISPMTLIGSPHANQLGLMWLIEGGSVVYVPWTII